MAKRYGRRWTLHLIYVRYIVSGWTNRHKRMKLDDVVNLRNHGEKRRQEKKDMITYARMERSNR